MADIFLDDATRTVGARMTEQEYALAQPVLSVQAGKNAMASMFASFLQQLQAAQAEQQRRSAAAFVERATPAQLAKLMTLVNRES